MVLEARPRAAEPRSRPAFAVDVVMGCATVAARAARSGLGMVARSGSRLGRVLPRPPVAQRFLAPDGPLAPVARRGRRSRVAAAGEVDRAVRTLVPVVVDAVLEKLDLTAIVRQRVDVDAIVADADVDAVAARLDLDAIVERLDLVGLAEMVVDGIDLPGIIRESSGSVAADAVRGVRRQSLYADEAVARAVERMLPRRRQGGTTPADSRDGP